VSAVSAEARATCERAIVLAGAARSGTTLLGRILHSCEPVEYVFEPPTLFALFAKVDLLDADVWRLIYETYLYEDFLVNALAGRSINTNRHDDSSAWAAKSEKDVEARLSRSWGRAAIEPDLERAVVAYKIPGILPFLPRVQSLLGKGPRVLLCVREPAGVITSLLAKAWFSDRALTDSNLVWLRRPGSRGHPLPFWLPESEEERWSTLDEVGRCALYYAIQHEAVHALTEVTAVSYERLTETPAATAMAAIEALGLSPGAQTETLVNSVRPGRELPPLSHYKEIPSDLRTRAGEAYAAALTLVDAP